MRFLKKIPGGTSLKMKFRKAIWNAALKECLKLGTQQNTTKIP